MNPTGCGLARTYSLMRCAQWSPPSDCRRGTDRVHIAPVKSRYSYHSTRETVTFPVKYPHRRSCLERSSPPVTRFGAGASPSGARRSWELGLLSSSLKQIQLSSCTMTLILRGHPDIHFPFSVLAGGWWAVALVAVASGFIQIVPPMGVATSGGHTLVTVGYGAYNAQ